MREAGSGTRAVLEAALRERGLDPAALGIALELPSNEAVRSAVAAGAGISGLSSLVVEAMIDAGRLVALPKIGRASCRERVCQYVSITVVAGSFNKKTN